VSDRAPAARVHKLGMQARPLPHLRPIALDAVQPMTGTPQRAIGQAPFNGRLTNYNRGEGILMGAPHTIRAKEAAELEPGDQLVRRRPGGLVHVYMVDEVRPYVGERRRPMIHVKAGSSTFAFAANQWIEHLVDA
jgi:hypothetical protein